MKKLIPSILLAFAAVVMLSMNTSSVVLAQPSDHDDNGRHAEDPLHEHMEEVKESLKALARNIRDSGPNDKALEHIAEMQKHILAAKLLTPETIEEMPQAKQAAAKLDFRRRLAEVLIDLAKVEIHLIDGDREKAWGILSGPVKKKRDAGHDLYQEEEDH